jgi:hypothetical protein
VTTIFQHTTLNGEEADEQKQSCSSNHVPAHARASALTPYDTWAFCTQISVANGKVHASTSEHTPPQPGVPETLRAMRSDGTIIEIGTVTTDLKGHLSYMWTPPTNNLYTITATFNGDESYGSSSAQIHVLVTVAPQAPAPAAEAPEYTPMFAGIIVAVVITICLVLYTLYTVRKTRK